MTIFYLIKHLDCYTGVRSGIGPNATWPSRKSGRLFGLALDRPLGLLRGLVQTIFGKISVIVTLGGGGGGGGGGKAVTLRKALLSASIVL